MPWPRVQKKPSIQTTGPSGDPGVWNVADGMDFDPWYYQHGDRLDRGVYRAEEHAFIEQAWTQGEFDGADRIEFLWHGRLWSIPRPDVLGDIHYVWVDGLDLGGGTLQLVLTRKRGWRERVKGLLEGPDPDLEMWESEAVARPGSSGDDP